MPIVGIIGGKGKMGRWFARFFRKNNCKVLVADLGTKLKPRQLVEKSDVVIFSVPIPKTVKLIEKYARYARKGSLLADFTSVKEAPVKAMLKSAPQGVEVLGMHPVFGPVVKTMRGQCVVLTPGRGKKWLHWMRRLLERNGAVVTISTPRKHDEMMAVIQGLTHASTIPVGHALRELEVNLKESAKFTSPLYRVRLAMVGRMLSQDAGLYAAIMTENPYVKKVLRQYSKSFNKLAGIVEKRNRGAFERYFNETANYFAPLMRKTLTESEKAIEKICNISTARKKV